MGKAKAKAFAVAKAKAAPRAKAVARGRGGAGRGAAGRMAAVIPGGPGGLAGLGAGMHGFGGGRPLAAALGGIFAAG